MAVSQRASTMVRGVSRLRLPTLIIAIAFLLSAASGVTMNRSHPVHRAMIVIDITQSMNVEDVRWQRRNVSRLEAAKQMVGAVLGELPCGSKIGLGIFTGHRSFVLFTPVEVCHHYTEISQVLHEIDWRMAWAARSEVAKGLHSGLGVAAQVGQDTRLLFVTDAHEAPPINADLAPKYRGDVGAVSGAILGVGGDVPLRIPKYDPSGKFIGYWRANEVLQVDAHTAGRPASGNESMVGVDTTNLGARIAAGREHYSQLKETYAKQLAAKLQLEYFRIEDQRALLSAMQSEKLTVTTVGAVDVSHWYALGGLLALLLHFLMPVAQQSRTAPKTQVS